MIWCPNGMKASFRNKWVSSLLLLLKNTFLALFAFNLNFILNDQCFSGNLYVLAVRKEIEVGLQSWEAEVGVYVMYMQVVSLCSPFGILRWMFCRGNGGKVKLSYSPFTSLNLPSAWLSLMEKEISWICRPVFPIKQEAVLSEWNLLPFCKREGDL